MTETSFAFNKVPNNNTFNGGNFNSLRGMSLDNNGVSIDAFGNPITSIGGNGSYQLPASTPNSFSNLANFTLASPGTSITGTPMKTNMNVGMGGNTSKTEGFNWMNGLQIGGNVLSGIGDLAKGWAAYKGIGLAKDQLAENKRQYDQNFDMQKQAYDANVLQLNNRINDQNAWKTAQGRNDLANLV